MPNTKTKSRTFWINTESFEQDYVLKGTLSPRKKRQMERKSYELAIQLNTSKIEYKPSELNEIYNEFMSQYNLYPINQN